jgi:hypothetical protein
MPLDYSTDVRWRLIYRDILELWLMFQLLQDKPHHTSTVRWQHFWIGICLSNESGEGDPTPGLHDLQILTPRPFPMGICERWCLRSASASNLEQLEGRNANSDCKIWWVFIAIFLGTKSNIVLMCAGQQKEHMLKSHGVQKNLNWSLEWYAFNFCVAVAFLSINLCNRWHNFNHPVC